MKKYMISALLVAMGLNTMACDVCGCLASDMGFGYIPVQNRTLIGLSFTHNSYNTTHFESQYNLETSKDLFYSASIWSRFSIKEKLILQLSLPYNYSSVDLPDQLYTNSGIGDLNILAYYQIVSRENEMKQFKLRWLIGSGIKAPTGNHQRLSKGIYIQNIQNGSGSWDIPFGSNFSLIKGQIGLNNETQYLLNGSNDLNFKFGNKLTSKTMGFYRYRYNDISLIPQIGYVFEQQAKDLIDADAQITRLYSGREIHDLYLGLDLYYKNIGLRMNSRFNMVSNIAENTVQPKKMLNLQFLYIFKK